jgi:uncharacterized protein (DUF433 family)
MRCGRVLRWSSTKKIVTKIIATQRDDDPRETPLYTLADAALYLGIPPATLRSWTHGRTYPTKHGRKLFEPLITAHHGLLSFANLAEAHVLQATRDRDIPIPNIRNALDYLDAHWPSPHPLLTKEFLRFGKQVFIKEIVKGREVNVNITKSGQLGLKRILDRCLERLERDDTGYPVRIFPLKTRHIVMDVNVASGQPVIKNTRLLAAVIWSRNKAGDSIPQLAKAYGVKESDVKEAIQHFQAAA